MKEINKEYSFGICLYRVNNKTKKLEILLGTHELTPNRWGLLKGKTEHGETDRETAHREFFEESGFDLNDKYFEKYFMQKNFYKDVGVWTYNAYKIKNLNSYFENEELKYKTEENDVIKWFQLDKLPKIHNSQIKMITSIKKHLIKKRRINNKKRMNLKLKKRNEKKIENREIKNRGRKILKNNDDNHQNFK